MNEVNNVNHINITYMLYKGPAACTFDLNIKAESSLLKNETIATVDTLGITATFPEEFKSHCSMITFKLYLSFLVVPGVCITLCYIYRRYTQHPQSVTLHNVFSILPQDSKSTGRKMWVI